MSAIAVCTADDGIVFAADGAMYNSSGIIIRFVSKLYTSPYQDCVYGHVGIADFGPAFVEAIDPMPPFDALIQGIVAKACQAYGAASAAWTDTRYAAPRATLIIGGWSESQQRFELYKLHSSEKEITNQATGETEMSPPWQLIPVSGTWSSSVPRAKDLETFGIDWDGEYSPLDLPARIVCANRAGSSDRGDGVYGVGGFLEMVVITRNGIKNWFAHEWPDVIGEVIDPAKGELMPVFPLVIPT
jgi:hypothetical protein